MGFGSSFIKGIASSGASSLTGLITGGLSQALGLSWSPQKAMREQEAYNKRIMPYKININNKLPHNLNNMQKTTGITPMQKIKLHI